MPVISFANPKGGAGKSTAALVLATTLSGEGATVAVLDCDRNSHLAEWRDGPSRSTVEVHKDIRESDVIPRLEALRSEKDFVICDLEGVASRLVSRAISRSRLVVIPTQASAPDAGQAARAIAMVREEEESFGYAIPYRVLFVRTSPAIPTRIERRIFQEMSENDVPMFKVALNERAAFKSMLWDRLALDELDEKDVNGLAAARENALGFAQEVIDLLAEKRAAA